jgi:zinc protease
LRTEIGGTPVFSVDRPGPHQAALVFRVGRADETLATSGLTHLVEHLALFAVDDDLRRSGGFVDHFRTVFFTSGTHDDIARFLVSVTGALRALPLERLDLEKRVLLTEEASAGGSTWQWLMGLRFGAEQFGLVAHNEVGLRRVDAHEVESWCASRFVSRNAAIWSTCPLPADLGLQLPSGRRFSPPPAATLAEVPLPSYVPSGRPGVVLSALGSRSTALTVALGILEQRVHRNLRLRRGLSYAATGSYVPLNADTAHLTFGADCLAEHATVVRDEILAEFRRLAEDGPGAEELTAEVEARVEHWSKEAPQDVSELDAAATDELVGARVTTRHSLIRELQDLTADSVARVVREALGTIILSAPTGAAAPVGFKRYEDRGPQKVVGHRYMTRGRRARDIPRRSRIVASDEAISFVPDDSAAAISIRYTDVAAVLDRGPGRVTIVDRSGDSIRLDLNTLVKGPRLEADLRRAISRELFIPFNDQPGGTVLDLSRQILGYRTRVSKEIERLPGYLQPGERVLNLATAVARQRRGLLALTDRRLLFLAKAASRKPRFIEVPLSKVTGVKKRRAGAMTIQPGIVVTTTTGRHKFLEVAPRERVPELIQGLCSPASIAVTPTPFDDSLGRRARDYLTGFLLVLIGAPLVLAHVYAAIWMLIWGSVRLARTYGRRRDARAFQTR